MEVGAHECDDSGEADEQPHDPLAVEAVVAEDPVDDRPHKGTDAMSSPVNELVRCTSARPTKSHGIASSATV